MGEGWGRVSEKNKNIKIRMMCTTVRKDNK